MKTCFKCHQPKPLSEYYKHPRMADGHLNKCKDCTKRDVANRVERKSAEDLNWILSERERHRLKARRQRAEGTAKSGNNSERDKRYRAKYPEKWAAHIIMRGAIKSGRLIRKGCEVCGGKAQGHHDDYAKPLEVRWLCPKHHAEHHVKMRDQTIINQFSK